jgi:4-hydroxybenzoate polyprenyltransferase
MKTLRLFWRLLRYRVAVMLVLFLLLAAALHETLSVHPWPLVVAAAALAFSYISATSSNDLADEKIDAINHPKSQGRPLITGGATVKDMRVAFGVASAAAILLASFLSYKAALVMAASIIINILYSLPPARLSYRTFLAPLALGVAYVGIPYIFALVVTRSKFTAQDGLWLTGLYLMFVGRIILKDFRDRKGDAQYHKPTFLLRFGKDATCLFSLAGLTTGGSLIIVQTRYEPWLAATVLAYLLSIMAMLKRLRTSPAGREEQVSIGVGARMGNGLLITLLAYFALRESQAPAATQMAATLAIAVLFFASYFNFLRHPQQARLGYKG